MSNPVLTDERLDVPMTYEDLAAVGGGLGSAGFVVYDERRNMIDLAYQVSMFLHVESCGQCTPCKTGTQDITEALELLVRGVAEPGAVGPIISRRLATVTDGSRCYLPSQERRLISSLLEAFPDDLEERIGGIRGDLDLELPRLVDLVDGRAATDPRSGTKRPDWTYSETPVRLTTG